MPEEPGVDPAGLRAAVAEHEWYHTLELAPGVVTPGWFDLRPVAQKVPLPGSLAGLRCLDIGTFDGFWAFEMERRGAAEVVAADVRDPRQWDWPPNDERSAVEALEARHRKGEGFELAHRLLASNVRYVERSIYDLDPEDLGRFDVVYLGSLLLHLRDPVGALARVREVCAGRLVLVDTIEATLSAMFPRRPVARLDGAGRPWWWQANVAGLVRMVEAAGFRRLGGPRLVGFPRGAGQPLQRPGRIHLASRVARRELAVALLGDPHAMIVATPA